MIPEFLSKFLPFDNKKETNQGSTLFASQDIDKVNYILTEFNGAVDYYNDDIIRSEEMWDLYSGINDSQYPDSIKRKIKEDNRNPFQANFIRQKVEGLAGSIVKNFFDVDFEPVNGEHSDLTRSIREIMLIEKELLDWNASYMQLVIDGLVHLGVEEMYIDKRYSPYGNIGFRHILHNHIILDPNWLTKSSWDLKRAWKTAWLTPKEIKSIYKTKADEIDFAVKMRERNPERFDDIYNGSSIPHDLRVDSYTDKFRVIEFHHIERENVKVKYSLFSGIQIPDGTPEEQKEWAIINGVDLENGVVEEDIPIDVYYVTTICPSLSKYLVLKDKKEAIQIGRLPFFPWSSSRINGKNSGIPDLLKSVQRTYNYRESMIDSIISSAANGAYAIDPALFDGDSSKVEELIKNWNKSNFKTVSANGAIASGRQYFQQIPKPQMDYGIVQELSRMIDLGDRISKQPAALDGRSEGSEETGILFARKQQQAEIANMVLVKSLEQHWNEKGEAWLLLAKKLHSGVYRVFNEFGSGRKIELNKPIVTLSGEVIENDISTLPRMKVIVTQSPEGITNRNIDRAMNIEMLRVLGPESYVNRALAETNVMRTLSNSKTERQKYEEAANLQFELAKKRAIAESMQLDLSIVQAQMQMAQFQQPQIPQLPQQGQSSQQVQEAPGTNGVSQIEGQNNQIAMQTAQ